MEPAEGVSLESRKLKNMISYGKKRTASEKPPGNGKGK